VADAEVTVDKEIHLPGDEATASAPGFGPAEQVQLALLSTPTLIGTFTADSTGQVTAGFSIAQTLTPGTHVAQFTGWCGRIATGDVVVGSPGIPASVDPEGSRSWPWWLLVVLAVCVGIGVWRLIVWRRRRREEEEDDYDDDDDDIDDGGLGLNADGAVDGGSGRPAPWPGPTKDAP
jgi:hypothetical protein